MLIRRREQKARQGILMPWKYLRIWRQFFRDRPGIHKFADRFWSASILCKHPGALLRDAASALNIICNVMDFFVLPKVGENVTDKGDAHKDSIYCGDQFNIPIG